jgi:hypothetical protein
MATSTGVSNLAPRTQARISAWEKRAQAQRDRVSAFLTRQPANAAQSARHQVAAQRLQQAVNVKRQWASAVKSHFDSLHEILAHSPETEALPSSGGASNRRKGSSAGE